jgi:hypothetical protein
MRRLIIFNVLSWLMVAFLANGAMAQHKHEHGSTPAPTTQKGQGHEMAMKGGPVQSATVEGYKITLEVMDMSAHMSMPGMKGSSMDAAAHAKSHALMVTVQDTASKEIISDARIQYILTTPKGAKENGKLEWSGDHYNGGFSPKEKGNYQIELKIESGGMERIAKFAYEGK